VLLVLLLCACNPEQEEFSETGYSVDGPVNTSEDIANSPFVGTFRNTYSARFASIAQDVFELSDDIPFIAINANGTFTLSIVDTEGSRKIYTLSGSFTVKKDVASFTAEGEQTVWFRMTLLNSNEMRYTGHEFYCVSHGDIFARETV